MAAFDEAHKACVCNEAGIGISFSKLGCRRVPWGGDTKNKEMDHHQLILLSPARISSNSGRETTGKEAFLTLKRQSRYTEFWARKIH